MGRSRVVLSHRVEADRRESGRLPAVNVLVRASGMEICLRSVRWDVPHLGWERTVAATPGPGASWRPRVPSHRQLSYLIGKNSRQLGSDSDRWGLSMAGCPNYLSHSGKSRLSAQQVAFAWETCDSWRRAPPSTSSSLAR